jgi:hypothetical protein
MSLILSLNVNGAVMMAADNALSTLNTDRQWTVSHAYRKLHITQNNIGISFGGDAETKEGIFLPKLFNQFLDNFDSIANNTPMKTARSLLDYMRSFDTERRFCFHIAGWEIINEIATMQIIRIETQENTLKLENKNPNVPFIKWDAANNTPDIPIKQAENFKFWVSVENAANFINFTFKVCSDLTEHMEKARIIGEKPDILVIYPFNHEWINKNKLNVQEE